METARKEQPYAAVSEGGLGTGGKFRKRPFRRTTQTTPYDRPPTGLRNPSAAIANNSNGWLSRLVDPAHRLITSSAHRLFSSVFRKRLPPPPPPEANQEVRDNRHESRDNYHEVATDPPGVQQGTIDQVDNSSSGFDRGSLTELEQILNQKTYTRSEIERLTALLHARTIDVHIEDKEKKSEVVPSEAVVSHDRTEQFPKSPVLENGIRSHHISTPVVRSSVLDEDVASPAELAKAYMGSRPSKVSPSMLGIRSQAFGEDSTVLSSRPFPPKSPIMPLMPRSSGHAGVPENGFMTPRSHGRSAIYSMARTPYSRVHTASTVKAVGPIVAYGGPSSSSQAMWEQNKYSSSKQGALKRRSSVLDNDIGSVGPIRRIRHKPNFLSSKGLSLPVSGSPLSITGTGVGYDSAQHPSSSMQNPLLLGESKENFKKMPAQIGDNSMRGTSFPLVSSKSSEMASKILQQLFSPKEKSSEFKLATARDRSPTKLSPSMLRGQALRSMETVDSPKFLENIQDNNKLDCSLVKLLPDSQDLTTLKQNKVEENGPLKLVAPCDRSVPLVNGIYSKASNMDNLHIVKTADSSVMNSVTHPPQKKRAFQMSAHEDFFDLDDDYPDGAASNPLAEVREKVDSLAERKTIAGEAITMEKLPSLSDVKLPASSALNQKTDLVISGGSADAEKSTGFVPTASFLSATDHPGVIATESTLTSDKSAPAKKLNAASPMYSFGDKVASPKESSAASPIDSFFSTTSADKVPQFPFTSSASFSESAGLKFDVCSDPKPESSSRFSTVGAGATGSVPKVPELDKANDKSNSNAGVIFRTPEPAFSSAVSTSTSTPSISSIAATANNSIFNNGSLASSPSSLSSTVAPFVFGNVPSQNSSSSSTLTATSATTITSSSSLSTSALAAPSFSATPVFGFGSSRVPSTSASPVLATSGTDFAAVKTRQDTSFSNLSSTPLGGTSVAIASTGSSNFGFSASATSNANNQSQGSNPFSADSGSVLSSQASPAGTGVQTFTHSMPIQFSSSASIPSFGSTGNTAFASGSSLFAASAPAAKVFNSGAAFGLGSSASSSEANSSSAISGTTSSVFGSSWQPAKSPMFGSSFNSTSSSTGLSFPSSTASAAAATSSTGFPFTASIASVSATTSPSTAFSFAASTASVGAANSAPVVFGASSGSAFSFSSGVATPASQPVFGSPNPGFAYNSASSGNNDQMNMEDSMAEDTVQASSTPTVPVFGQTPVAPQSSFGQTPVAPQSSFGQTPVAPQSSFVFGSTPPPSAAIPFQFGIQQNSATPQNPSPFQASGSLGGSFSVGTGGTDKSARKIVRVSRTKARKK